MNVATVLKSKGRAVTTVRPSQTLSDVAERLASKKIGAIVVVGDAGRVVGIISERDVVRAVAERGAAALQVAVDEVMTRSVVTCNEATTLDELMEIMTTGRFRHVPVVTDGALVGIVSIGDVVKHHIADMALEVTAMKSYLATG
jgi:CBS domain-containing protein